MPRGVARGMPVELQGAEVAATAAAAGRVATGITWLVDNDDAYRELIAACRAARRSVWMTQLAFDADCVAWVEGNATADGVRLANVLLDACGHGVQVRVLLNASLVLDTAKALRAYFAEAGADPALLRVRGVDRFPQLLHAKIVVVDEETAFLIGSPFANGYWDDSAHAPSDARRPQRELGGRPLHDLSLRLAGPAVAGLHATFAELWNGADDVADGDDEHIASPAVEWGAPVHIVQSSPTPKRAHHAPERTEILPELLAGIRGATRTIYIEHQYLSSLAVIHALSAALRRSAELEVIMVLNQNPDVTAYRGWQNRRLEASGLLHHPRVGLFSLWTTAADGATGRAVINQVFVHSKVVLVDDAWAMVGSANLDGVSLQTYGDDFSGRLGQRVFRGVRNMDVAAIVSGDAGSPARASVLELRTALWREHLDAPDLDVATTPAGGWLAWWRRRAAGHVTSLNAAPARDVAPRITVLPYSRSSTPAHQLRDAGVTFANQEPAVLFAPSWMEVHLSPNWLRNVWA
jgi:phosphatidylserine/phosphatidylglycerophosphate/cardiolipin synthase-like enzyme